MRPAVFVFLLTGAGAGSRYVVAASLGTAVWVSRDYGGSLVVPLGTAERGIP